PSALTVAILMALTSFSSAVLACWNHFSNCCNEFDNFYTNLGNTKQSAQMIKFADEDIIDLIDVTMKLYNSILIIHRVSDSSETTLLDKDDESIPNAKD
ncbi:hypothetical protein, partial [Marinicella litoralis]|uniref:hypothetical protein n=2 Tax=Marinicella litoralis TaxID=644220 RepID=UPI001B863B0E